MMKTQQAKENDSKLNIRIKELFAKIKDNLVVDRLNAVEWIVLGIILMMIFVTLFYVDNLGMFLTYFWVNEGLLNVGSVGFLGNNQMTYGIVQQILCELWVFPTNIIYHILDVSAANTFNVLWFKFSMPVVLTLCMREMIIIAEKLKIERERIKWMLILCVSSVLVALPVFHIAQTDILYAYFILLGIRAVLENNWKKFILFFAMAISCKIIAIFVFIPLVLLREKRIFFVLRDAVLGVIIVPAERIWYKIVAKIDGMIVGQKVVELKQVETVVNNVTTIVEKTQDEIADDFLSHFYHKTLFFEFPAIRKGYTASLLIFLFVLLCIWCYVQKKNDDGWKEKCIYVVSVSWITFFVMASPSPYWIVVMYPMMFLMIFLNKHKLRINLLLVNAFTLTMFLVYVMNTGWVYGGSCNLDYLLFKGLLKPGHISETDQGPAVVRYLNNLGVDSVMNVVTAVCLAVAVAIVIINHYKNDIDEELTPEYEKKLMHGFTLFQIAFLTCWYMVNVWVVCRW